MADRVEGVTQASTDVLGLANRCVDQIEELAAALRRSNNALAMCESVAERTDPELSAALSVLEGALALLAPIERLGSLQNRHKIREATNTVADAISLAQAHIKRARVEFDADSDI